MEQLFVKTCMCQMLAGVKNRHLTQLMLRLDYNQVGAQCDNTVLTWLSTFQERKARLSLVRNQSSVGFSETTGGPWMRRRCHSLPSLVYSHVGKYCESSFRVLTCTWSRCCKKVWNKADHKPGRASFDAEYGPLPHPA